MDDLASKINEIMSDPEKMKEIQNLGRMMGLNTDNSSPPPPKKVQPPPKQNIQTNDFGGIDPSVISKLAPILTSVNREDDTTRLLDAMAPFLSAERREKLEKIKKMLVIIRLLPNIKNLGLF
ncbi:MAG: hypothetical protein ACI4HM_06630 [Ruminococcus sp.]